MKYVVPIVFLLFFIAMFVLDDDANNNNTAAPASVAQVQAKKAPLGNTYGEQGILNTWPGESEGIELSPTPMARNYYVIVDGSGSMLDSGCSNGNEKIHVAKNSLGRFIDKIPQSDNIGLYVFDGRGEGERVPLGSGQHDVVKSAVQQIRAGSNTPLGKAVNVGHLALTEQGKRQLGYGEYHLVIVTDGVASNRQTLRNAVSNLLQHSPITVHTIGFCINDNHTLNQPEYMIYKAANNPQMLEEGLDMVLAEAETFDISAFEGN